MYKAIIIDDEEFAREVIKEYLENHSQIELIGEFADGFKGLKAINELKPDLVFLDIQMPKLTGFEIIEVLEEKPGIIFTTAYDQFAIRAFEENAVDYLLKPFGKERFDSAIEKFQLRKSENRKEENLELLKISLEKNDEILNRMVVKVRNEIRVFPVDQIYFLEAQDDYVMIYLEKEKYLKQKTMNYFENHLDKKAFLRVHRSYMVRLEYIHKIEPYDKSAGIILLRDGRRVPVSKSGLAKLKQALDF